MFTYYTHHDTFRDAFRGIKTLPFHAYGDLPDERPLAFRKITVDVGEFSDQRWVLFESGKVRKCEWEQGLLILSKGNPEDNPPILAKTLIKNFFKVGITFFLRMRFSGRKNRYGLCFGRRSRHFERVLEGLRNA